jgi:uncharacterized repeat protein (TIGR03847 family)
VPAMSEVVVFDPVDSLAAGALGVPGQRTFLVQARKGDAWVTVLVEKAQVAVLAAEVKDFVDRIDEQFPSDEPVTSPHPTESKVRDAGEPLFRARAIGIGFDTERNVVMIELREFPEPEEDAPPSADEDTEGWIARLVATKAQVRAMADSGLEAVEGGRPPCPLCDMPMDPDGHHCPRWN